MGDSNETFLKSSHKLKNLDLINESENQKNVLEPSDQDKTPKAEVLPDSLQQFWQTGGCSSVDIEDEKIIGMTCSYSEILDDDNDNCGDSQGIKPIDIADVEEKKGITTGYVDEVDISTPVCEGVDPTQIFLAEDRVNAFLRLSLEETQDHSNESNQYSDYDPFDEQFLSKKIQDFNDSLKSPQASSSLQDFSTTQLHKRLNDAACGATSRTMPIDPTTISDLESFARNIATSMDTLIENLTGTLHSISSLTVDCVETYRDAVCKTCDAVDSNIKSMYQLMAKCEELSKSMKPIYHLQEQIKEIRRLLDLFESVVHSGSSK